MCAAFRQRRIVERDPRRPLEGYGLDNSTPKSADEWIRPLKTILLACPRRPTIRKPIALRPTGGNVEDTGCLHGRFRSKQTQFTGEPITEVAGFYEWNGSVTESWTVKGTGLYETKPQPQLTTSLQLLRPEAPMV
jgi:hypothetical protein